MDPSADAGALALAELVRREWPQLMATLVRVTGDLSLAEDAAQDAVEQALQTWHTGPPEKPGAWILTVARRRAIDRIRREATGRRKRELLARLEAWDKPVINDPAHDVVGLDTTLHDDQLRLIFGCCHPALSKEAQIALTLRIVAGLATPEIARAFLVPETTMAQRIVRAKRKIATAAIPFALPADSELLERLTSVHNVIYLTFNEGYASGHGTDMLRRPLCLEAIRLARLLAELVADDAETLGLVALLLSTNARADARFDNHGVPVLLPDQNRAKWDAPTIAEARDYLDRSLRLTPGGRLQVQAAISQLHVEAADASDTDWAQIELLYARLEQLEPTPVVRLNRAVAAAMHRGPAVGLTMLEDDQLARQLVDYRYFHAARADLLSRLGRTDEARRAYDLAIEAPGSDPETALLRNKRDGGALSLPL